ncbi:hypothetical protein ACJX0J_038292, partial [Zea mays]
AYHTFFYRKHNESKEVEEEPVVAAASEDVAMQTEESGKKEKKKKKKAEFAGTKLPKAGTQLSWLKLAEKQVVADILAKNRHVALKSFQWSFSMYIRQHVALLFGSLGALCFF